MGLRKATKYIIILVTIGLIVYDVFAFTSSGVESTISRVLLSWGSEHPIICVGSGVLIGHLFWPQKIEV